MEALIQGIRTQYTTLTAIDLSNNGFIDLRGMEQLGDSVMSLDLSKNRISSIEPLSTLVSLRSLNLAQNNLSEINALARLPLLEEVDLRGNRLTSLHDFSALRDLQHLHTIRIAGNPVAVTPHVVRELFHMLPSLKYIDNHRCQDEITLEKEQNIESILCSESEVPHLQAQVSALQDALAVQEAVLESNGVECATLCHQHLLNRFAAPQNRSSVALSHVPSSVATERLGGNTQASPVHNLAPVVGNFPYAALLKSWRGKTLSAIVNQTFAEKELVKATDAAKSERHVTAKRIRELEAAVITAEQRTVAQKQQATMLSSRIDILTREKAALQTALNQSSDAAIAAVAANKSASEEANTSQSIAATSHMLQLRQLSELLPRLKSQCDKFIVLSHGQWSQVSDRLRSYEQRLSMVSDAMQTLKVQYYQRDLSTRNSQAILEAQERLQTMRFEALVRTEMALRLRTLLSLRGAALKEVLSTLGVNQNIGAGHLSGTISNSNENIVLNDLRLVDGLDEFLGEIATRCGVPTNPDKREGLTCSGETQQSVSGQLSSLALSVDAEALLKSIFRTLDVNDCGTITPSQLCTALYVNGPDGVSLHSKISHPLTPLGDLLRRQLGVSQWETFTNQLSDTMQENLTWGECLLLLLPCPGSEKCAWEHSGRVNTSWNSLTRMSQEEILSLSKKGFLETTDSGVLPYALDMPLSESTTVDLSGSSQWWLSFPGEAGKVIHRLLLERAVLQKRLQLSSRQSSRLAENIRTYFAGELAVNAVKARRRQHQVQELSNENERLRSELMAREAEMKENRVRHEELVANLTADLERCQKSLSVHQNDQIQRLEEALSQEKSRVSRWEGECSLLQKENSRREARLTSLQRELQRMMLRQSTHAEEVSQLKSRLSEEEARISTLQEEKKQELQSWNTEKNDLLEKLSTLQQELTSTKEAVKVAEAKSIPRSLPETNIPVRDTTPTIPVGIAPSVVPNTTSVCPPGASTGTTSPSALRNELLEFRQQFPPASFTTPPPNSNQSFPSQRSAQGLILGQLLKRCEAALMPSDPSLSVSQSISK